MTRRTCLRTGASVSLAPVILNRALTAYGADEAARRAESGAALSKSDLPTPSLLLNLDRFESNLARMAAHAKKHGLALRPHAKTHKCVDIARQQVAQGAHGVCVATLREAEVMSDAGIPGLLITSELVGREKIRRLLAVTRKQPGTLCVVDDARNAEDLAAAARADDTTLNVLLDVDPGSHRTGVQPGPPALTLAEAVVKMKGLALRGVHAYSGASAHVIGFAARQAHSRTAMTPAIETFQELRRRGMPIEILSGGSTGTYNIDPSLRALTELQVGSYVFMDVEYRGIGGMTGAVYDDFQCALTVLATVVSQTQAGRATVDAGFKAFATDRKFGPTLLDRMDLEYRFGGDEHGLLTVKEGGTVPALGQKIEFIVPHCDPNVNLYDRMYLVRGENVIGTWPIARGYG